MNSINERVLIVEDDAVQGPALRDELRHRGFLAEWQNSGGGALSAIRQREFDIVLTDLNMPEMNGVELAERIASVRPDVPVIVLTGYGNMSAAVAAMRAGVCDFITKPADPDELADALERAMKQRASQVHVGRSRDFAAQAERLDGLAGASPAMQHLYEAIQTSAAGPSPVLIVGEPGTGKEVVARALHRVSDRASGPFVPVDCSKVPPHSLEAEIFGQARGTNGGRGVSARAGQLIKAQGGTLFLHSIEDMPWNVQKRLAELIQTRKLRQVEGGIEIDVTARIVAASEHDFESAARSGRISKELVAAFGSTRVHVPPLRDRGSDVEALARMFVEHFAGVYGKQVVSLSAGAAEMVSKYRWPGNVQELKHAMEHAVAVTTSSQIVPEDFPERIRNTRRAARGDESDRLMTIEEIERRHIWRVLEAVGWNKTRAAKVLGLDRKTLYRRLERYDITSPERGSHLGRNGDARSFPAA